MNTKINLLRGNMSLSQIIRYDNPTNFSYDTTKIEIVDGKAKLKLIPNPGQVFTQDFSSDSGFIYDSTKSEFSAGQLRQKDQRPADSLFAAKLSVSTSVNWSTVVTPTTTIIGAPLINNGKLDCLGYANNGVRYEETSIGSLGNSGTIRFKFTPAYNGGPSQQINIVELSPPSGHAGRIILHHTPSGATLRMTTYNNLGQIIHTAAQVGASAWLPTSGQEYEFAIVIDTSNGAIRLYIDGTFWGQPSAFAYDRGTAATRLNIGAGQVYSLANGSYRDLIVYTASLYSSSYAPGYDLPDASYLANTVELPAFTYTGVGTIIAVESSNIVESGNPRYIVAGLYWNGSTWTASNGTYSQANTSAQVVANLTSLNVSGAENVPVSVVFTDTNTQGVVDLVSVTLTGQIYPTDNPSITHSGILMDDLVDFIATLEAPSGTSIKGSLVAGNTPMFFDGNQWTPSSGYIQTNTVDEIQANKDSFDLSQGYNLKVKIYLHSDTGLSTPNISQIQIDYDFYALRPAGPNRCILYGWTRDILGLNIASAKLHIQPKEAFFHSGTLVIPAKKTIVSDSDGYLEGEVIETETVNKQVDITVEYPSGTSTRRVVFESKVIPNEATKDLSEMGLVLKQN